MTFFSIACARPTADPYDFDQRLGLEMSHSVSWHWDPLIATLTHHLELQYSSYTETCSRGLELKAQAALQSFSPVTP